MISIRISSPAIPLSAAYLSNSILTSLDAFHRAVWALTPRVSGLAQLLRALTVVQPVS